MKTEQRRAGQALVRLLASRYTGTGPKEPNILQRALCCSPLCNGRHTFGLCLVLEGSPCRGSLIYDGARAIAFYFDVKATALRGAELTSVTDFVRTLPAMVLIKEPITLQPFAE
ncbi:MAG TPA: hypothetical protein VEK08_15175 [Planctomycetota bacterium]|nr:hypothetical protein [Planctomycetota bacterium]